MEYTLAKPHTGGPGSGRPLRLLIVNAHGTADGGTETGIAELASALIAAGVDVSFLNAFPPADLVEGVPATVLHKEHWRVSTSRRLASHVGDVASWPSDHLVNALVEHAPDVVHTHNLTGIGTGIWEAARRRRIPVVHTLHDYHLLCPRTTLMRRDGSGPCRPHPLLCGMRTRLLGRWVGGVQRMLAVSQHLIDTHARFFIRIPSALMRNPLRPMPLVMPAPGAELRRIGYIGALHPNKGVDVLLRALPDLEKKGIVLRIAGRGALEGEVKDAARRSRALEYVGFALDDAKVDFLKSCDLGVLPSIWREPGGPTWAMSDWLSAGRPVLVSPTGGLAEVAGVMPGSVATKPTVAAILRAIDDLRQPDRWVSVVQDAQSADPRAVFDAWVAAHLDIYSTLDAGRG